MLRDFYDWIIGPLQQVWLLLNGIRVIFKWFEPIGIVLVVFGLVVSIRAFNAEEQARGEDRQARKTQLYISAVERLEAAREANRSLHGGSVVAERGQRRLLSEMVEAGISLQEMDLSGVYLAYARLGKADLKGANLSGADLSYADLSEADLTGANLSGADLTGAKLTAIRAGLHISGVLGDTGRPEPFYAGLKLDGANLSDADLSNALLFGASFSGADVSGANFTGASLSDSAFDAEDQGWYRSDARPEGVRELYVFKSCPAETTWPQGCPGASTD